MLVSFNFSVLFCLLFLDKFFAFTKDTTGYNEQVAVGGNAKNAGLLLRLTKSGFDYLSKFAGDAMNEAIPKMPIQNIKRDLPAGDIELKRMHIIYYKPANQFVVDLGRPNIVNWTVDNMDVTIQGIAETRLGVQKGTGDFNMTAIDIDVHVHTMVLDNDGYLQFDSQSCRALSSKFDIEIQNFQRSLSAMFYDMKPMLLVTLKRALEMEICNMIFKYIAENLNAQLKSIPTKVALGSNRLSILNQKQVATKQSSATVMQNDNSMQEALEKMYLNFILTEKPQIYDNYADLFGKGEISYMGYGGTPFYPNSLYDSARPFNDQMLNLVISDYVINSMLYYAYQQSAFNMDFDLSEEVSSSSFQSDRRQTLRKLILKSMPEIEAAYPGYQLSLIVNFTRAPAVLLNPDKAILITESVFTLTAKKSQKSVVVLKKTSATESDVKVRLKGTLIKGNLTINKIKASLISTSIKELTQDRIERFVELEKLAIEGTANTELVRGLRVPILEEARLIQPRLKLADRKALIVTNFRLDNSVHEQLVRRTFDKDYSLVQQSSHKSNRRVELKKPSSAQVSKPTTKSHRTTSQPKSAKYLKSRKSNN